MFFKKLIENGMMFFPFGVAAGSVGALGYALVERSWAALLVGVLWFYLMPIGVFHFLRIFFPLKEGKSYVNTQEASAWLVSFRIQKIYDLFPISERILMLVPELYSIWLRLWGSNVGWGVFWGPQARLLDRSLYEIGNFAFIGNSAYLSPHLAGRGKKGFFLILKKIQIGKGAMVGAFATLGPGACLPDQGRIELGQSLSGYDQFRPVTRKLSTI